MIEILKYNQNMKNDWDLFVSKSFNGTIFQKRQFLSYHVNRKFDDCSLLFKKRGKIIAIIPAATVKYKNKKTLSSHPGASFGGIVHNNISFDDCDKVVELLELFCKENSYDDIFMVQTPSIYNKHHQNELVDYVMKINAYDNNEYYISNVLNIENNIQNQILKIVKNKKRTVSYYNGLLKKYNITFKWVDCFDEFYPILVKNKKKHNSEPTHSLDELEILKSRFPDDILQLMLYTNKRPIAGMTIFKANNKGAILFYSMFDYEYNKMQPIPHLMHYILDWAKNSGLAFIDYGVSHLPQASNPLAPSRSLIKFKEEFGCFGVVRNAYRKKIND